MERQINILPLKKRFSVTLKSANKEARNKYYPNASDCCGVKLKQEKFCSSCNAKVEGVDTQRKIVKLGKDEHLISSQALKQVKETLEQQEDIELHTFLGTMPEGAEDRYDGLLYAYPADKRLGQYAEIVAVLKDKYAVGKAVFNGNEYQIIAYIGSDSVLRIRKLVEEGQRYDFNRESVQEALKTPVNAQIIELEKAILGKELRADFDVTQFRDQRQEYEERVIEEFVLGGKVPELVVKEIAEAQENDELERLKALMG